MNPLKPQQKRQRQGDSALDLVESAVHLLRESPLSVHLLYHLSSAPFVLALLWFWSDMTRGAHADARLTPGALILSALYLVMKTGQAAFCSRLRNHVARQRATPWSLRRVWNILVTQAVLQPLGFVLVPLSIFPLLMVPFPWVLAFLQGVSVSADASAGSSLRCGRDAFRQAVIWPGQNHGILGLLLVCLVAVFIDVFVGVGAIPFLARTLFGITTDFNLSVQAYLNTTVLLAIASLTYLVMDPLVKSIYVLRTFQAEAIRTGDDLRARFEELRQDRTLRSTPPLVVGILLLLSVATANGEVRAQSAAPAPASSPASAAPTVEPGKLESAIRDVLAGAEYTWRSPRELSPDEPDDPTENPIRRWIRKQLSSLGDFTSRNLGSFFRALGRLLQRLFTGFNPPNLPTGNSQIDWLGGFKILVYVLLVAGVALLAWFALRLWQKRKPTPALEGSVALTGTPDLRAEHVSADQLPEDGWIALALEMAAKGEWRLALRALYLASLAHLAQRELVRLAPSKSNHEYRQELRRRARALPAVQQAFTETADAFDRVWYGTHAADASLFDTARARLDTLRTTTPPPA